MTKEISRMKDENKGVMAKVQKYYDDYGLRARELKAQGKKIIGYVCSFVPLEMITAADCVPFRIRGNVREPITKGDSLLETIVCPFIRSCFDLTLKGKYDFLSGIVIPHACDSMVRSYSTWAYSLDLPYTHFLNIPSVVKESSFEFMQAELETFRKSLEKYTGKAIPDVKISQAIELYNQNRAKAKALYDLRKSNPPQISGSELTMVMTVGSSLPIEESNALFDEVLAEVKARKQPLPKGPRVLIDGACIDNFELIKIVEGLGAQVVADTICNGSRDYWPQVKVQSNVLDALGRRYLDKVNCPKTYRENKAGAFAGDAAVRFGDIGFFAKEFKVDAAILYVYKYCDPFGFEVPARKAYYESIKVPMFYLEDEYSSGTIGQLKTRIQAFLEMIA
jgi:benzoyl-CoA reductase/2-hydroxyglutaryl-CoA dehydratase subunit BcrC/BadD/HgdB